MLEKHITFVYCPPRVLAISTRYFLGFPVAVRLFLMHSYPTDALIQKPANQWLVAETHNQEQEIRAKIKLIQTDRWQ